MPPGLKGVSAAFSKGYRSQSIRSIRAIAPRNQNPLMLTNRGVSLASRKCYGLDISYLG
jgi:hypothetical protein